MFRGKFFFFLNVNRDSEMKHSDSDMAVKKDKSRGKKRIKSCQYHRRQYQIPNGESSKPQTDMNRQQINGLKVIRPSDIPPNPQPRKTPEEDSLGKKLEKCEFVFLEKKSGTKNDEGKWDPVQRKSYLYELNPHMKIRRHQFPAIIEEREEKEVKKFGKSKSFSQKSHGRKKSPKTVSVKDIRKKSVGFKNHGKLESKVVKTVDTASREKEKLQSREMEKSEKLLNSEMEKSEKRALSPQKEQISKFRKPSKESGIPIMKKISLINEILKEHAQKPLTDSKSCHEIKLEPKNLSRGKSPEKRSSVRKNSEEKPKAKCSASEPLKKVSNKRSLSCPDKKKIEKPQSRELTSKTIDMPKKENFMEKDKSPQRRVTHTDQLIANKFKVGKDEVFGKKSVSINEVIKVNEVKVRNALKPEAIKKALEDVGSSQPSTANSYDSTLDATSVSSNTEKTVKVEMKKDLMVKEDKTKAARAAELRDLAMQAMRDHKIFCIFDSHWYIVAPVREELLSRGWLEVIPDRRLIPKRRPPPPGPISDRDMSADHNVKAILTARENLIDDMEKVPKSALTPKKTKNPTTIIIKKTSEESINETVSDFRIVPPNNEKKKNNLEIREFIIKVQSANEQKNNERSKSKDKDMMKYKYFGKDKKIKDLSGDSSSDYPNESADEFKLSPTLQYALDPLRDNRYLTDAAKKLFKLKGQDMIGGNKGNKTSLTENESKLISKIIQSSNGRINFMWLSIKPGIHLKCFNYSPEIINKFQKTVFCTKIGLWNHLNDIRWYAHEVTNPAKSPRMYNTGEEDDLQAFFQDFQMTACLGMLKWLAETFLDKGPKAVVSKRGKVPLKAFEFAIKQCENYIKFRENDDLASSEELKPLQDEWSTFLQWFYIITNEHGKIQESSNGQLLVLYTKALETLKLMRKHWPEIDIDGRLNIWIMKPYCASCGRGIFMTNNVYYIGQHSKYIVQKYIERPFLIYNTKFDIRQWFMITKLTPLEIWMYKECYLRFCTQPFALKNLHESVHLSNNSVQRKYVSYRDPTLPDQNMWDSTTFQQYLQTVGYPNAWEEIIYPGMRDAIVSTMLAAQDTFDSPRKNWFEVYGADFMLSANIKDGPWLIEINENPAMDPSTKVTAKLCPQMLRDVIKVVVDRRANKNAPTGQWELIYRQNYSPSFGSVDLDVKGKKIARLAGYEKEKPKPIIPPPVVTKAISPPEIKKPNESKISEPNVKSVSWKSENIKFEKENHSEGDRKAQNEEKGNLEVIGTGNIHIEPPKLKISPENVKKINDHFRNSYRNKPPKLNSKESKDGSKGVIFPSAIGSDRKK